MEFIAELIFEVILEGVFGLTIGNPKVKTWTKTIIYFLITQAITALMVLSSVHCLQEGNTGGYVIAGLAVVWGIGMLIATVYSHKRNWKKEE